MPPTARRPNVPRVLIIACWLVVTAVVARAEPAEEIADMDLAELAEVRVTVATGIAQPLSEAPAVATVITAEEIAAMGVTHLDEVLERVAGVHVVPSQLRRLQSIYSIRGIHSAQNAQVLMLVDGLPINQVQVGGQIFGFRMPVHFIERVEVVRGPGSAVYGADAVAGVINVVTKRAHDIAETEAGARFGSFDTQDLWLTTSARWLGWDVAFGAAWQSGDGDRDRIVEEDQQTALDRELGTDASRAPGPLETRHEVYDLHLDLRRRGWGVHLWGWGSDHGVGAGFADLLDPEGYETTKQYVVDVVHQHDSLPDDWRLESRLRYQYVAQNADARLFPAGAVLPVGRNGNIDFLAPVGLATFTDGAHVHLGDVEQIARAESVAIFEGWERHRLRLAAGAVHEEVEVFSSRNFGPGVTTGADAVIGPTLVSVTGTEFIYLPDSRREQWYLSLQDEWRLGRRWQLTAGVRYDHYSEIGGTWNPRLALVFTPRPGLTGKLLYGSAFRAPTIAELYSTNNPINLGNPELEPENVDTFELAWEYRPSQRLRTGLSLFYYEMDDLIELVPDPERPIRMVQNFNAQEGYGGELEGEWRLATDWRLGGNFAWHRAEDAVTGRGIAGPPRSQLYLALDWRRGAPWGLRGELHRIGERSRAAGDPRPPLDGYTLIDLVARRTLGRLELTAVVRNAFDEAAYEPATPGIPGDYPLAGRAVFLEVRGRF